ncbi:small GTPase superfamily [Mycena floridula]|nr:small GTPase superfamily [Mycena floridula]
MSPAVDSSLRKRKIAVLGPRSVGKSSLLIRFIENHFGENYYPTIESSFSKGVKLNGTEYDCDLIDTAGQDEYSILNAAHAIGVHGFVLVYSVTSRNSFNMVQIVYDKIVDFCGRTVPCVIVGSKTDLQTSRQVAFDEGMKLAQENNAAFVETSAKDGQHIAEVFERCLEEIHKRAPHNQVEARPNRCHIM